MRLLLSLLIGFMLPLLANGQSLVSRDENNNGAQHTVSCGNVSILAGHTAELAVGLTIADDGEYNGYQFDIFLPEGVTLATNGDNYAHTLSDRYNDEMLVIFYDFGGGHYRVMVFSLTNALITGTDGELIRITLLADANMTEGQYTGEVKDFKLSRTDGLAFFLPEVTFGINVGNFAVGDVNHDRSVNISDIMLTVGKVLGEKVLNFYEEQGDVNKDGDINVTDIMSIVYIVLYTPPSN